MLVIVWVARGPPLVGGTMAYSAHGVLTIPYIEEGVCFIGGPPIGIPYRGLHGPYREIGVCTGVPTCAPRRRPASVWLGRPPPIIGGVPPYPAFVGLTYPL